MYPILLYEYNDKQQSKDPFGWRNTWYLYQAQLFATIIQKLTK